MFAIFGTSFVVGLSGALMPGPLLALVVSRVIDQGFWAGPALISGHILAELATVAALTRGLGRYLQQSLIIGIVGITGGLFLIWMSWSILSVIWQNSAFWATPSAMASSFSTSNVVSGFVISVSNPYWIVWWATIGTTYVAWALKRRGATGVSAFYAGHILSDVAWYVLVSLAIAAGRRIISDSLYQALLVACAAALLGLGVYFIVSGSKSLSQSKRQLPG